MDEDRVNNRLYFGLCTCICHHQRGVTHMVPCCDQPPLDPFAETSAIPQTGFKITSR